MLAFAFGVSFSAAILFLVARTPDLSPSAFRTCRIILAIAAAGVASLIPDFLEINLKVLRIGSALVAATATYALNPPAVVRTERQTVADLAVRNANGLMVKGDYVGASRTLAEAVAKVPKCRTILYNQATLSEQLGDYHAARDFLVKITRLKKNESCAEAFTQADLLNHLALAQEGSGDFKTAYTTRLDQKRQAESDTSAAYLSIYHSGRLALAIWLQQKATQDAVYLNRAEYYLTLLLEKYAAPPYLQRLARYHLACALYELAKLANSPQDKERYFQRALAIRDELAMSLRVLGTTQRYFIWTFFYEAYNSERIPWAGAPLKCDSGLPPDQFFLKPSS
ncbi:hypothetical protein AWB68_04263 [Caballeronia choica]|uniref:Tetratricopeptide repeat protein n=2 Tax=Caballeronia choica TaxID=326476 RepID=A0A158JVC8_9BURK|nr:hypothetical protein AWB68_04263 [Caballeronia choica]